MFLGAALATAGILFAIVATDGPNPLVPPRRDDRLATLGFFASWSPVGSLCLEWF